VALGVRETGSGANNHRPGLVRVLQAAQRGDIDTVLVWKLDRFGRSAFDLLGNIRHLEAARVRFMAVTQGIDIRPSGDPMSRLLLTVLSAVAEFERDLVVERTRLGLANARRAGRRLGRPLAPTVQELKTAGATWAEIADQLKCTVWAARMAAKKGGRKQGLGSRGKRAISRRRPGSRVCRNAADPVKATTDVLRDVRDTLRYAVDYGGLTPASHERFLMEFSPVMNRVAVGPPKERNVELLAMLKAGIVDLAPGPNPELGFSPADAKFFLRSRALDEPSRRCCRLFGSGQPRRGEALRRARSLSVPGTPGPRIQESG